MKVSYFFILTLIYLVIFICTPVYPCTTFVVHDRNSMLVGHNLDWITGVGLLIVNPRNLEKTALVDPSENPLQWISRYGSITFDQAGRDLPFGGMNEQGLVIEQMGLDCTVYPPKDHRRAISACQWIQFQLDNASTIEEVIKSDTLLRIVDAISKFHFIVSDRYGHSTIIEFLDGKMVWYPSQDYSIQALANSKYTESVDCLTKNCDTKKNRSLFNFCTVAAQANQLDCADNDTCIAHAFQVLSNVSQGVSTKWSIVYDRRNMKIYFKCYETPTIVGENKIFTKNRADVQMKIVDLCAFDFHTLDSAKVIDLDSPHNGIINPWLVDYSTSINKDLITRTFTFYKAWGINIVLKDEEIEYLAKYPESFRYSQRK